MRFRSKGWVVAGSAALKEAVCSPFNFVAGCRRSVQSMIHVSSWR